MSNHLKLAAIQDGKDRSSRTRGKSRLKRNFLLGGLSWTVACGLFPAWHYWGDHPGPIIMIGTYCLSWLVGLAGLVILFRRANSYLRERKQVEKLLRESEAVLNEAQEIVGVGSFVWDMNSDGLVFSPNLVALAGLDPSSQKGGLNKTHRTLVHPDDRARVEEQIKKMRAQGKTWPLEFRIVRPDGSKRSWRLHSRFSFNEAGQPVRCLGVYHDITEQIRADKTIRFLANMVDESPAAISVHDWDGNFFYANQRACDVHGYSREEYLALNLRQLDSPESAQLIEQRMSELRQKGELSFEVSHLRKDGSAFPLQVHAKVAHWRDREVILSIATDISERKQAEAEKARLEDQLRQAHKMEVVGQLAGGVAHDFNNLLQAINGFTELAMQDLGPAHPVRSHLLEVAKAGDRAAWLVTQLLTFSRRQIRKPEDLELNQVVGVLLKMLERVIGKNIRLDFVPGPGLGMVHADRGMLEQMLMNLCVNARDAMPKGGSLTIETKDLRFDEAYCGAHNWARPGRFALLIVRDTGCGMDADTLEHLFEPFFSTKEVGQGTGLGLATVYGIVQGHDGMIQVSSEPGQGTTFQIYLPSFEKKDTSGTSQIEEPVPSGRETILVAEDNEMVRNLVKLVLEQAGYQVLAAEDGQEAVSLFERHAQNIHLLFLDVVMPNLGGQEALERIRKIRPSIPVLFASGYNEDAIHTDFVLKDGFHFVQKPYQVKDLLQKVRTALDLRVSCI
jgi:PAS domain S-box-containing protein